MSSDTDHSDTDHSNTDRSDTDVDRTDIELHRGSQQSVIALDRGHYTIAVLVDDDSTLPAAEVERALCDHAPDLAAIAAVESGSFGALPPAEESIEQALDGPLRADGGRIIVCPRCDSSQVRTNAARHVPHRYRCETCEHTFDDPDRRPRKTDGDTRSGLSKRLAESDADDLAPDGGGYRCDWCETLHPSMAAAVACCDGQFDDSGLVTDGGFPRHTPKADAGRLDDADRERLDDLPKAARVVAEILDGSEPLTNEELTARTRYKSSTITNAAKHLVRAGIANRVPYIPDPQRSVYYIPSDADETGPGADSGTRLVPDGGQVTPTQDAAPTCQAYENAIIGGQCGAPAIGRYEVRVEADDGVYTGEAWLCETHSDLAEGPVSAGGPGDDLVTDGGRPNDDLEDEYELRLRGEKHELIEVANTLYGGLQAKTEAGEITPPDHRMVHELVAELNDILDVAAANEAMAKRLETGDVVVGESVEAEIVELDDPDLVPDGGIPEADTEPTDRRGGEAIPPTAVECPYCGREGVVEREVLLCICGRWFEVVDDEQDIEDGNEIRADGSGGYEVDNLRTDLLEPGDPIRVRYLASHDRAERTVLEGTVAEVRRSEAQQREVAQVHVAAEDGTRYRIGFSGAVSRLDPDREPEIGYFARLELVTEAEREEPLVTDGGYTVRRRHEVPEPDAQRCLLAILETIHQLDEARAVAPREAADTHERLKNIDRQLWSLIEDLQGDLYEHDDDPDEDLRTDGGDDRCATEGCPRYGIDGDRCGWHDPDDLLPDGGYTPDALDLGTDPINGHDLTVTERFTHDRPHKRLVVCTACGAKEVLADDEDDPEAYLEVMLPDRCERIVIREADSRKRKGVALRRTNQSWWWLETFTPADTATGWAVKEKFGIYPEDIRALARAIERTETDRRRTDGGNYIDHHDLPDEYRTDGGLSRTKIADRTASKAVDGLDTYLKRLCRGRESVDEADVEEIIGMIRHDVENTVARQLQRRAAEHYDHDVVPDGGTEPVEPLPIGVSRGLGLICPAIHNHAGNGSEQGFPNRPWRLCYDCRVPTTLRHLRRGDVMYHPDEESLEYEYITVDLCPRCWMDRYGVPCSDCGQLRPDQEAALRCCSERQGVLPDGGHEQGIVGECTDCGGRMIEHAVGAGTEERTITLVCQDCGTSGTIIYEVGGENPWQDPSAIEGVTDTTVKPINWIECPNCHGDGWVVGCIDDLCHAAGECLHDGDDPCPECHTTGRVPRVIEADGGRETCWVLSCEQPPDGVVTVSFYAGEKDVCDDHGEAFVDEGDWDEYVPYDELATDGGQDLADADEGDETVPIEFTDERDVCPECGLVPSGIRTDGPDTHVLEPCGHEATLAVRRAVLERALPEGGEDLAANLVEYLEYLYLEASEGVLQWPADECEALARDLERFRQAWGIEPQTPHPAVHFDSGVSGGEGE